MAYSFRHTIPMIAGTLVKEKVRCGKQNCRCAKGKRLHGWYHYLYWRDYPNGGSLKKTYVPRAYVPEVKRTIATQKKKENSVKIALRDFFKAQKELL